MRKTALVLTLAALLGFGCEEESGTGIAGNPPTASPAFDSESDPGGRDALDDYVQPPVNMPTPYRPPQRSSDSVAEGSSGGGGGGGRDRTTRAERERERFQANFEDVSPNEMLGLIQAARAAANAEDPGDGCERMFASFQPFMERGGADVLPTKERFLRECRRMPAELEVCLKAPSERTDEQTAHCQQLIGTGDIFGDGEWEDVDPPANRRPTRGQLEQARQAEAEAQRAQERVR